MKKGKFRQEVRGTQPPARAEPDQVAQGFYPKRAALAAYICACGAVGFLPICPKCVIITQVAIGSQRYDLLSAARRFFTADYYLSQARPAEELALEPDH